MRMRIFFMHFVWCCAAATFLFQFLSNFFSLTVGTFFKQAALNMIAKSMSLSLKDDGILVYLFCPGWVQTDMGGANASLRPSESVSGKCDADTN